ncbi:MAG: hypothetical protein KDA71_00440, partial [Planctomycetales bacterium]|nr:hypothetical protein [Planctomycetales bacterium]
MHLLNCRRVGALFICIALQCGCRDAHVAQRGIDGRVVVLVKDIELLSSPIELIRCEVSDTGTYYAHLRDGQQQDFVFALSLDCDPTVVTTSDEFRFVLERIYVGTINPVNGHIVDPRYANPRMVQFDSVEELQIIRCYREALSRLEAARA